MQLLRAFIRINPKHMWSADLQGSSTALPMSMSNYWDFMRVVFNSCVCTASSHNADHAINFSIWEQEVFGQLPHALPLIREAWRSCPSRWILLVGSTGWLDTWRRTLAGWVQLSLTFVSLVWYEISDRIPIWL